MRARDVVPRLCQLGDYAYYTHRASSVTGNHTLRDVGRYERQRVMRLLGGDLVGGVLAGRAWQEIRLRQPYRRGHRLHRWLAVWPEAGYGTVTGITLRSEGVVEHAEEGSGWLREYERWPLYEVRTSLTGLRMLVPVWACAPVPAPAMMALEHDQPPYVCGPDNRGWEAHVDAWLRPRRGAGRAAA